MVGFVPELEHLPPLAGEVGTRVQGANSLVVDLRNKRASKPINTWLGKLDGTQVEGLQGRKGEGMWAWSVSSDAAVHLTGHPASK